MTLKAIALNCTLKAEGESSTDTMIKVLEVAFAKVEVEVTETIRIAAHDVRPGVTSDEGDGDEWPAIRRKILAHDILILAGPSRLGHRESEYRALEFSCGLPAIRHHRLHRW